MAEYAPGRVFLLHAPRDSSRPMQDFSQFPPTLQMWVNDVLVWVGFGTLVGLLAKAIMPGRDPGGAIATLTMGIGGVVIGCGVFSLFTEGQRVTPISPVGLVVATAGAFGLLFFYRLLGGHYFIEGEAPSRKYRARRAHRRSPTHGHGSPAYLDEHQYP